MIKIDAWFITFDHVIFFVAETTGLNSSWKFIFILVETIWLANASYAYASYATCESSLSLANVDKKWRIERENRYYFLVETHAQKVLEQKILERNRQYVHYLKKLIELIN